MRPWAALPLAASILLAGACKREKPPTEETTVRFAKVPLVVDIPAGWRRARNDAQWLTYRSDGGGALVAMTGEKSCGQVEKRLTTGLLSLGMSDVVWTKAPRDAQVNGLRATVAEGTAAESGQAAKVRYSLVQADKRRGCLLTLVAVRRTNESELGPIAETILRSIRAEE